ncbi:MAG TPA: hypothetical protein VNA24_36955 [Hyalangium sp.]|nr:hypothetical protein [Hyalangium sp.]
MHLPVPGDPSKQGALFVASANFDKCFDTGAVLALDLDNLGLPAIGSTVGSPVETITDLKVAPESAVQIESFAGQMAVWRNPAGGAPRLFVPTRAEENYLHAIDIQGKTQLECVNEQGRNCLSGALSLTRDIENAVEDQPRAPAPLGVTVNDIGEGGEPEVWVTHVEAADSPARSARNFQTYVVHIPAANQGELSLSADNFIPLTSGGLSIGGAHATAVGQRYVYVTGRGYVAADAAQFAGFLLRLIDRGNKSRILETDLGAIYRTLEARDVLLGGYTADPNPATFKNPETDNSRERIYIVARGPDTLLVVDVLGVHRARPSISVVNAVLLPGGASYAALIRRGTSAMNDDIVAVTSTATSRTRGAVVLYDTRLGQIVKQVDDVGRQPYGIAVHHDAAANRARLFVTNFSEGRVAVIDIPDLTRPQGAELVAYLGAPQGRDEKQGTSTCEPQEIVP